MPLFAFLSVNVPEFKKIAKYEPGILRKLVQMSSLEEQDDDSYDEFDASTLEKMEEANELLSTPGITPKSSLNPGLFTAREYQLIFSFLYYRDVL